MIRDPRWLGGPESPVNMLDRAERVVGEEVRGAVQTGAYRYVAHSDGCAFGYVDCGRFDRCTVYEGERPDGPIITDTLDVATRMLYYRVWRADVVSGATLSA